MQQPLAFLSAVVYALFLWWFVTGLIVVVYGRSRWITHLYFICATVVMLLAVGGLVLTRNQTEAVGVYLALTCGILLWGWQVTAYYLGYVTGPQSEATVREMAGRPLSLGLRFRYALQASLFHELSIVSLALVLVGLTWAAANRWGLWIFLALWLMHSLAKLNVFLGVRNFRIEFLPAHLHYLEVVLSKRKNNPLLLITVVVGLAVCLAFFYRAIIPGVTPADTIGFLVVGTMIGLGVVEHLLLVLPIPSILWGWGFRPVPQTDLIETEQQSYSAGRTIPKRTGCGRLIR